MVRDIAMRRRKMAITLIVIKVTVSLFIPYFRNDILSENMLHKM